eukprot:4833910-Pyramimonas_sp.AAC.1
MDAMPCSATGLTQYASPWTQRVGTDILESVRFCYDEEELLTRIGECPWLLIEDDDCRRDFARIDFRRVRAAER